MRRIVLAALGFSVTFLGIYLFAQQKAYKPGVERWEVKTTVADGAFKHAAKTVKFSTLIGVPNISIGQIQTAAKKEDENGTSFQDKLINVPGGSGPHEGDMVSTTAFLQLITAEPDGDYHIQISDAYDKRDPIMIVEIPRPEYVKDATLKSKVDAARTLLAQKLNGGEEIEKKMCMLHPPQITFTGQWYFDRPHLKTNMKDDGGGRGKDGHHAASLWEIHPVTAVAFVSKKDPNKPKVSCP